MLFGREPEFQGNGAREFPDGLLLVVLFDLPGLILFANRLLMIRIPGT